MRLTLTAAALAAGIAGAAAQAAFIEIETDDQMVEPFGLTVEALEDMSVFGADGEEIGEIEEVLGSQDGTPAALAVEAGGFLGIGERDVVIELGAVEMTGDRLSVDMTADDVEALPVWDD